MQYQNYMLETLLEFVSCCNRLNSAGKSPCMYILIDKGSFTCSMIASEVGDKVYLYP
jgi:hypothetical protein